MVDEVQQRTLVARLRRIEGQVRGIRRMVQESRRCIEILQQLGAAQAALERVSVAVLRYHAARCVPEGVTQGGAEQTKRLAELVDMVDRFRR